MIKNIVSDPKKYYGKYKPLTHAHTVDEYAVLKNRQSELLTASFKNWNENWFEQEIIKYWSNKRFHFNRQYLFGKRIFDFFNEHTGCAIEIDGPEHDIKYDRYRDVSVYIYEAIVVYRIRNGNKQDLKEAIQCIMGLDSWDQRKRRLNIAQAKGNFNKLPKKVKDRMNNKKHKKPYRGPKTHVTDKEIQRMKNKLDRE